MPSSEIVVNFADVELYEIVPPGRYTAVVDKLEMRQKEGAEHPYLAWDYRISAGEEEGRHVFANTSFSPKALWRLVPVLAAVGIEYEKAPVHFEYDEESGVVTQPMVVGQPVILVISNSKEGGTTYVNVDEVLPISADTGAGIINVPSQTPEGQVPPPPGPVTTPQDEARKVSLQ